MSAALSGLVLAAAAAWAPDAEAALVLQLSSGGNTTTINDNGAGDLSSLLGSILFMGSIGVFDFNITSGSGEPVYETPQLDLLSIDVNSHTGGTLTVALTQTDLSQLGSALSIMSGIGGTVTGTTVGYQAYIDSSNAAFGHGTTLANVSNLTGTPGFHADFGSVVQSAGGLFSLTEIVTINAKGAGVTSFDALITVPEPPALALLALGGGLAWWRLRRRRSEVLGACPA